LAWQGAAVVVVTHRLDEVVENCDSLTVLRDGRTVAESQSMNVSVAELARLLTGHTETAEVALGHATHAVGTRMSDGTGAVHRSASDRKLVARLENLRGHVVEGASFDLHAGEVVGVAGLVGSGRDELGPLLGGAVRRVSGGVAVNGMPVGATARDARRCGIGFVPADRKRDAMLASMSVGTNITVGDERARAGGLVLETRKSRTEIAGLIQRIHLEPPDPDRQIRLLSGGNQQKVVLARSLRLKPSLLVLDDPMQGVDVEAKGALYRLIRAAAADGAAVLFISSDAIELAQVSDRVIVFRHGGLAAQIEGDRLVPANILTEVEA
jgi:ribose transport system ATP-binding protein